MKKRFVEIFNEILSKHPIFNKTIVSTKFPVKERPKFALIIRSFSGSSQEMSMDNFECVRYGYACLANMVNAPANSIEWVKDDTFNIKNMSPHGYYIVRMIEEDQFVVDPYLWVDDEILKVEFIGPEGPGAWCNQKPVNPGSETIFTTYGEILKRNIDYTIDYNLGKVLFKTDPNEFGILTIDYQTLGTQKGPFKIGRFETNNNAIPGVILAFGDRIQKGDEQVVVISHSPEEVANCYTGRWNSSMEIICVGQDPDQQERLLDFVISTLWADWQDPLVNEGIEIQTYTMSGESEDLEMEIPEEYNFTGGISLEITTDWHMETPLISTIRGITPVFGLETVKMKMDNLTAAKYESTFDERMNNSGHQIGLVPSTNPIITQPCVYKVDTRKY